GTILFLSICNHRPCVQHGRQGLQEVVRYSANAPIDIVALSSNDADNYPDDSPEELARVADEVGYPFPLLYDATQEVAKAFGAVCTPDVFRYDRDRRLVYRGRVDCSRPSNSIP